MAYSSFRAAVDDLIDAAQSIAADDDAEMRRFVEVVADVDGVPEPTGDGSPTQLRFARLRLHGSLDLVGRLAWRAEQAGLPQAFVEALRTIKGWIESEITRIVALTQAAETESTRAPWTRDEIRTEAPDLFRDL